MALLAKSPGMAAMARGQRFGIAGRPAPAGRQLRVVPAAWGKSGKAKSSVKREVVVPEPSYSVPLGLLAISAAAAYEGVTPLAALAGLLGVFLTIQASRVQFRFDDEALEVVVGARQKETENAFVGGANRWRYDSFVNWEFWWPAFPVLVYFKETQTRPEGQIHFFPIIFNGKQLYDVMAERCGPSKTSGPK